MAWTEDDLNQHPKRDSLLRLNKIAPSKTSVNEVIEKIMAQITAPAPAQEPEQPFCRFTVPGEPFGKPRMTQRDVWQKRPCVLKYRDFCDRIRAAAPEDISARDCFAMYIVAHIPVPPSWSKKEKAAMIERPHRAKPDADNVIKSVGDALFKEDSKLWDVRCRKYWCAEGDERTVVKVLFDL
jgi:Holliday junction resolvase RusA-like endonuclease